MTSSKAETKPFWMDDTEWERRYPQMPQANIAENVVAGVPDLKEVEKGNIVGAYTFKDGLLVYHFYKKDRKKIFDEAFRALDAVEDLPQKEKTKAQNEISHRANVELSEKPWWPDFEKYLSEVFSEVFKYQEYKATFYSEVDSWSVILPAPSGLVTPNQQQLEKPFAMLAFRVGGN